PQTGAFVPSSPAHWRNETVQLTGFDNSDVIVKFVVTADYGNNLYIDNINLDQTCTQQTVSVNASAVTACVGEQVQLVASGATTSSWSTSQTGSVISVPTSSAHTTVYKVTSTDADGCGDTASVQISVNTCVGIAESVSADVQLFPNPSNGEFSVRYS